MDAKEFCEIKDYKLGVKWSENYIELAKAMEEYHQDYIRDHYPPTEDFPRRPWTRIPMTQE